MTAPPTNTTYCIHNVSVLLGSGPGDGGDGAARLPQRMQTGLPSDRRKALSISRQQQPRASKSLTHTPVYLYKKSLRKSTGRCMNDFTAHG
jgi:hypothetical protein